jgi:hypothetical protein
MNLSGRIADGALLNKLQHERMKNALKTCFGRVSITNRAPAF